MKFRIYKNTDLTMRENGFGLGTISTGWWRNLTEGEAIALMHKAFDLGITLFDSADTYGNGLSEELIAKAFPKQRDEIVIARKVSIVGARLARKLALIYAWTGEKDLALDQLALAARIPSQVTYSKLRLHPYLEYCAAIRALRKLLPRSRRCRRQRLQQERACPDREQGNPAPCPASQILSPSRLTSLSPRAPLELHLGYCLRPG